jgi:ABC-type enterochelin transport system substrate-binding protein
MSTPSAKLRRKQKRKGAVIATSAAALDVSSSTAASRSSDGTAQDLTVSSNRSDEIPVNEKELAVLELYLAELIDQLIVSRKRRGSKGPAQARGPPCNV